MKYKAQNLLYLEWCISIGKVIDDSQGLLKPRASNASVCYQLAHCLDNLRYKDECGVRTRDSQNILKWYICTLFCFTLTCRWERTIDFPLVNSKFFLMKK